MPCSWFLQRVALLPFCFSAACAHVQETRTRQVVDDESVRLSETPRPELSKARVRASLTGRELRLVVSAEARCVVHFGERLTTREHVRRTPDATTLGLEAVFMAVGLAGGIAAQRGSSSARIGAGDVLGSVALGVGLGAGAALAIDASHYSDTRTVRTQTLSEGDARVAPCKSSGPRPMLVELRSIGGRSFVAPLDGFGRGQLTLPDDIWADDSVDFDVRVDGVLVKRLVLVRRP